MASLQIAQALASMVYLITLTVVGIRLLWLFRRTRARPELLLGVSLLLGATIGGPLEGIGVSARQELGQEVAGPMILMGKLFLTFAIACQLGFIRHVFRPDSPWAKAFSGALLSTLIAAFVGYAAHGSYSSAEVPLSWFCIEFVARGASSTWLAVEAFRYHGMMKRRLRLGMADPAVTNRFFLWAWAGVFSIAVLCGSVPPLFLDPVRDKALLSLDLLAFSAAGVAVSLLYWLTFFPPASYLRLLKTRAQEVG